MAEHDLGGDGGGSHKRRNNGGRGGIHHHGHHRGGHRGGGHHSQGLRMQRSGNSSSGVRSQGPPPPATHYPPLSSSRLPISVVRQQEQQQQQFRSEAQYQMSPSHQMLPSGNVEGSSPRNYTPETVPPINPPARTRSTPPTISQQHVAAQSFRFTPHKAAYVPAPPQHPPSPQHLAMHPQFVHGHRPPMHFTSNPILGVPQGVPQAVYPPMAGGGRSQSQVHMPAGGPFPPHVMSPMHRRAPPQKRASCALLITDPTTGKPISMSDDKEKMKPLEPPAMPVVEAAGDALGAMQTAEAPSRDSDANVDCPKTVVIGERPTAEIEHMIEMPETKTAETVEETNVAKEAVAEIKEVTMTEETEEPAETLEVESEPLTLEHPTDEVVQTMLQKVKPESEEATLQPEEAMPVPEPMPATAEPETVQATTDTETVQATTEPGTAQVTPRPETVQATPEPESVQLTREVETVQATTEPETVQATPEPEAVQATPEPEQVTSKLVQPTQEPMPEQVNPQVVENSDEREAEAEEAIVGGHVEAEQASVSVTKPVAKLSLQRLEAKKAAAKLAEPAAGNVDQRSPSPQMLSPLSDDSTRSYSVEELLSLQPHFTEPPADLQADLACLRSESTSSASTRSRQTSLGGAFGGGKHRISEMGGRSSRTSSFRPAPSVDSSFDRSQCGQEAPRRTPSSYNERGDRGGDHRRSERGGRAGDRFRGDRGDRNRKQRTGRGSHRSEPEFTGPVEPLKVSETRWQPVQVSDEFLKAKRKIKGLLNKLTLDKFEALSLQFVDVLRGVVGKASELVEVVEIICDKALGEPHFSRMYAELCVEVGKRFGAVENDLEPDKKKEQTLKRILLDQCQREFISGVVEIKQEDQSPEDVEFLQKKQKLRFLGNVQFIGELFKLSMLSERIVHICIHQLLTNVTDPREDDMEALCRLLVSVGKQIDRPMAAKYMGTYLERMAFVVANHSVSARIRFIIQDVIDLRANAWVPRRKKVEAKTIDEIHRDAEKEASEKERDRRGRDRGSSFRFDSGGSGGRGHSRDRRSTRGSIAAMDRSGDVRRISRPAVLTRPDRYSTALDKRSVSGQASSPAAASTRASISARAPGVALHRTSTAPVTALKAPSVAPSPVVTRNPRKDPQNVLRDMVKEFFSSQDSKEAKKCLAEVVTMDKAKRNHMIVSDSLSLAMDGSPRDRDRTVQLLVYFVEVREIESHDIVSGFEKLAESLSDVALDVPFAAKYCGAMYGDLIMSEVVSLDSVYSLVCPEQVSNGIFGEFVAHLLLRLVQRNDAAFVRGLLEQSLFFLSAFVKAPFQRGCCLEFVRHFELAEVLPEVESEAELSEVLRNYGGDIDSVLRWLRGSGKLNCGRTSSTFLHALLEHVLLSTSCADAAVHTTVEAATTAQIEAEAALFVALAPAMFLVAETATIPVLHLLHTLCFSLGFPKACLSELCLTCVAWMLSMTKPCLSGGHCPTSSVRRR